MKPPFINRDGSAEPRTMIYPTNPGNYFGMGENRTLNRLDGNLFSRKEINEQFLTSVATLSGGSPSDATVEDLQLWGQHAWKAEHGTVEAAARFGDKLVEETGEFDESLVAFINNPSEETKHAAISEAGDVLWSLSAGLSNSGVSIEYAIQNRLMFTAKGTLVHTPEGMQYPVWRDKAIEIAMSNLHPITVGQIDDLFEAGYVPEASTAMNIDPPSPDPEHIEETYSQWKIDTAFAHILSYEIGAQMEGNVRRDYDEGRHVMGEQAAYFFLRTLYTLREITGATYADVWPVNFAKITARVQTGRIDHADGERSPDLL
ncbi:MAG: hypothetical protein WAO28_04505 [Candidatus Microsaccharimonas sp.]